MYKHETDLKIILSECSLFLYPFFLFGSFMHGSARIVMLVAINIFLSGQV